MPLQLHQLALTDAPVSGLARWLVAHAPGPLPEDLAEVLVILPSSRAAAATRHALLETAGGDAVLLPAITTARQLSNWLVEQLGLELPDLPPESLRSLLLAPALARTDWLADRPQSALGLAEELVSLFDEVRLAGLAALVLDADDDERLLSLVTPDAAEVVRSDLGRLRMAWRLYRGVLPLDHVDARLAALQRAHTTWPGPLPSLLVAAHLGRVDGVFGGLLLSLAQRGTPSHLLTIDATDPRSRLLLATYRDEDAPSHPLAGIRRLARELAGTAPQGPVFAGADIASRLHELDTTDLTEGPVSLLACHDPEHESRVVAALVCEELARAQAEVIVATADRALAARIVAQLRDAGVDVDDTRGRSLAGLPAGRLLRDVLRVVQTGWRFGPLFEVLTHPYVDLAPGASPGQAVRTRVLESEVRASAQARGGRAALQAMARAADDRQRERHEGAPLPWSIEGFVGEVAAALAPLEDLAGRDVAWGEVIAAIRTCWSRFAPGRPLAAGGEPRLEIDDLGALAGFLDALEAAAPRLAPRGFDEIAGEFARLLSSPAWEVRPHRRAQLPVRVMGLVEARLERADFIILAGLGQDVFPGRIARPLFLPDRLRRGLGLAHWRQRASRDSELLLRLLHAAPRVVLTWPAERQGQPSLPSPLVQRLQLVAPPGRDWLAPAALDVLYRREEPDWDRIGAAERAFAGEGDATVAAGTPSPSRLSHAALSELRGCAYRYLLGRVLQLRRTDALEPAYRRLEYGTLAHGVMKEFLNPRGSGWRALTAGDADGARSELLRLAGAAVQTGVPQARLWRETFAVVAPQIVTVELKRARQWRPAALEVPFTLTLDEVAAWLRAAGLASEADRLPADLKRVPIEGYIDRIDVSLDAAPMASVIDFKTGSPASLRDVREGLELQVPLYALAVEAGTVPALAAPPDGGRWRVDNGGYYGLKRDAVGLPQGPQLPPGAAGREILAQAAAELLRLAVACLDPEARFPLVREDILRERGRKFPCEFCEFRAVCRLEERPHGTELASRLTGFLMGDWGRYQ